MADETVKLRHTAAQVDDGIDKANAAAPKSTVYTKAEADAALAAKADSSDVYDKDTADELLEGKVNVETGKGLSTNDYTNAEKEKLANLENYDDTEVKASIANVRNTAEETAQEVEDARGTYTSLGERLDDMGGGGGGGTSNYNQLTNKPSINGVTLTGDKTTSDLGIVENVQADWSQTDSTADDYIKNKPNIPSGVVVDQVYDGTSTNAQSGVAIAGALSDKVDKVTGKGLSTNDYTTEEKDKLANLENYNDSDLREQVNAVSDYGKLTINKQRTSYNSTTNKLTFNFDMAAESDTFQLRQVGMIATNNAAIKYQLTLDTAPETDVTYVKIADVSAGQYRQNYNWTKTSVNPGDTWYAVPFMKYDNGDDVYLKYGHLYSITANNDETLAIIAICKE